MRFLLVTLVAVAACGGQDGPACPATHGLYCNQAEQGLTCEYATETGTSFCSCDRSLWTCNDCPGGDEPVGACSQGQSCSVWGFENACSCTCDANGQWRCALDDPNPSFHCAP